MNIEGPNLRDIQARGVPALQRHIAQVFAERPLPAAEAPHNAADLIESGDKLASERKLDRDVAA